MISFPTILLRLGVAALLGAIIGVEREQRERGAGMRTLALVSLGSALFTIISAYAFLDLLSIPHVTLDPTRIASYIVAGIGFLGAGTIFLSRESERVKGLTTAASIWVIAAIGIACGAGMLLEATVTAAIVLIGYSAHCVSPTTDRGRCYRTSPHGRYISPAPERYIGNGPAHRQHLRHLLS